jgi:two-component system sensor histidine kinase DesK
LAYLACALVSRVVDANPHPDRWYALGVIACFVLPTWYALGRWQGPWDHSPVLLLAVQAAVTYIPLFVLGQHWVGGVDGLLGGLALAVLHGRARWLVFGALVAVELAAWLVVGVPYQPTYHSAIWLLVAYTNVALGYFGLSTATRLLERLEATSEILADAAVDQQRLATAKGLQATILRRLNDIQLHAVAALNAPSARATGEELRQMGAAAREAASSARRIVSVIPEPATPAADDPTATPTLAQRTALGVTLVFAVQFVMNTVFPLQIGIEATPVTNVAAIAIAVAMIGLQMRHSRMSPDGRPRGWVWTLGAQAVLCFALYPVFGVTSTGFIPFVCGSVLLLIAHPVRWALAGGLVAILPILTLLRPSDIDSGTQLQWGIYAGATSAAASLVIYGLGRFVRAAAALAENRARLAETAVTRERVRLARDTHDTLGLALSAIALKSDLAQALLTRDRGRARREIAQTIHLSRTLAADADSIVHGKLSLHLDDELATARSALDAAGATVTVEWEQVPLSADRETELAAILREAVANVLRHSRARSCSIRITENDGVFELQVVNDGAAGAEALSAGRGLENIRERTAALGGTASTVERDGSFTLMVSLPSASPTLSNTASTPAVAP